MKSATLAEHKYDLSAYSASLLDMNAIVDTTSHDEELVTAFLSQTNTHPSDIVRSHFNAMGVKFFLADGKEEVLRLFARDGRPLAHRHHFSGVALRNLFRQFQQARQ